MNNMKSSTPREKETYLAMSNDVTIIKRSEKGLQSIKSYKYKELEHALRDEPIITVNYYYGQTKIRVKQLQKWGYSLKTVMWQNTDAPHANVQEIWERQQEQN